MNIRPLIIRHKGPDIILTTSPSVLYEMEERPGDWVFTYNEEKDKWRCVIMGSNFAWDWNEECENLHLKFKLPPPLKLNIEDWI